MYAERDSGREVEEIKSKKSEVKDPNIKFYGKSIGLPETFAATAAVAICEVAHSCDVAGEESSIQDFPCSSNSMFEESNLNGDAEDQEANKSQSGQNQDQDDAKEEIRVQSLTHEDLKDSNTSPLVFDDPKAQSTNSDVGAEQSSKTEEDQQEKALKKPDKILPCPRCNSMDTKFCYFNNYNVNQPRHFCKNCHRYWTAGGTMRNMPVGAGRRKNKYNAASQFPNVPEALQSTRLDGIHHPVLNPNGTVIPFTSNITPCESIATVSHGSKENGDDHSSNEEGKTGIPGMILNCHPLPCFPGAPWPWQWCVPPSLPPTFPPSSFPMPFYSTPPPYWAWNVPWFVPPNIPLNSSSNSPTLGKHSRDDNEEQTGKEGNHEKRLWVPKTLRICDPIEAAKSSIWTTLGIKNDKVDSGGGLFKAFQSQKKGEEKTHAPETSAVLQANPAALSRSLNFRESS